MTINFITKKESKQSTLHLRLKGKGIDQTTSTNITIDTAHWSKKKQRLNQTKENAIFYQEVNLRLSEMWSFIDKRYKESTLKEEHIHKNEFGESKFFRANDNKTIRAGSSLEKDYLKGKFSGVSKSVTKTLFDESD